MVTDRATQVVPAAPAAPAWESMTRSRVVLDAATDTSTGKFVTGPTDVMIGRQPVMPRTVRPSCPMPIFSLYGPLSWISIRLLGGAALMAAWMLVKSPWPSWRTVMKRPGGAGGCSSSAEGGVGGGGVPGGG